MPHSIRRPERKKPQKPYPDFPLWLHPSGGWCKKIKGKAYYFGKADDPDAALKKYLAVKDDLFAGRVPRSSSGGLTLRELVNKFLNAKRMLVDSEDLSPRTFKIYHTTCARVLAGLGGGRVVKDLRPEDFEWLRAVFSATLGPESLKLSVTCTKMIFRFGYESMLIEVPVRFGPTFKGPSKRTQAELRNHNGSRMFSAEEVRAFLAAADIQERCWILLGVQAGFGNHDLATLTFDTLDLGGGWVNHPRPKNGTPRRCPLMPETLEALRKWLAQRPQPASKEAANLVF